MNRLLSLQQKRSTPIDEAPEAGRPLAHIALEPLPAVQPAGVSLHLLRDESLVSPHERFDRVPVEPLLGDLPHIGEIARLQGRCGEQPRSKRFAGVVQTDQRVEIDAGAAEGRRERRQTRRRAWLSCNGGWAPRDGVAPGV